MMYTTPKYKEYWKNRYQRELDFYLDTDDDPLEGMVEKSRHPESRVEQCLVEALDVGYAVGRVPACLRLAEFSVRGHELAIEHNLYRSALHPLDLAQGQRASAHAQSLIDDEPKCREWIAAYESFYEWSRKNVAPDDSHWEAQVLSAYRLWLLASGEPNNSELDPLLKKLVQQSDEADILRRLVGGDRSKKAMDLWEVFFDWVRDPKCTSISHMPTWAVRLEHGMLAERYLNGNGNCSVGAALERVSA